MHRLLCAFAIRVHISNNYNKKAQKINLWVSGCVNNTYFIFKFNNKLSLLAHLYAISILFLLYRYKIVFEI